MILVSEDEESNRLGGRELFHNLQIALQEFGLEDEVAVSTITHLGLQDALPLVMVYPEAVIYGPVNPGEAHFLVEEHLYKGRIAERLLAPEQELGENTACRPSSGWCCSGRGALTPKVSRIISSTTVTPP